jgi:predicted ATPase
MLHELHLSSFKCFERLDLRLRPLTLLSGVNSGGKSSVIQSMVLLSQTFALREWGHSLMLEGPDLALGNVNDVINQKSPRKLTLGASSSSERLEWTFGSSDGRALSMDLESLLVNGQQSPLDGRLHWLLPEEVAATSQVLHLLKRISWISAERTGPRELLPLRDAHGHSHVGVKGELAAGLLYWREFDPVSESLCFQGTPNTLFHQVRAWMQYFFPGCDLKVSPVEGASAVSLRWRSNSSSDYQRPQNVGFGLTQLFPIVVALLSATDGEVILIENPEVHLHPGAQQKIGRMLALVAATGVQVIVETHSDHVLNGIRLAAKSAEIAPSAVAVHFFAPASNGGFTPISPNLDRDGRLDRWPEGFFDQFDVALSKLM